MNGAQKEMITVETTLAEKDKTIMSLKEQIERLGQEIKSKNEAAEKES